MTAKSEIVFRLPVRLRCAKDEGRCCSVTGVAILVPTVGHVAGVPLSVRCIHVRAEVADGSIEGWPGSWTVYRDGETGTTRALCWNHHTARHHGEGFIPLEPFDADDVDVTWRKF